MDELAKRLVARGTESEEMISKRLARAEGEMAMAEAYDISVALHAPLGPIATVAALQIDACTPNCLIQEFPLSLHYNTNSDLLDYLVNKEIFAIKDGFVSIPSGPGLGIEIDEEKVRDAVGKAADWKVPTWRHEDGSLAEW